MKQLHGVIICIFYLVTINNGWSQAAVQGDCVYPIIFIHGWGGSANTWADVYDDPDFFSIWGAMDNDYTMDKMQDTTNYQDIDSLDASHVYHALLNASQSTILQSDVFVQEEFINAPPIIENACVYAINFNNSWNNDTAQKRLIHPSNPNTKYPESFGGESKSNEAASAKQGFALGKAIAKILEITGKEKVILVGHSMGGIAAREYLQRSPDGGETHPWWVEPNKPDGHRVAKLLTLGTPHLGSNRANINDPSGASAAGQIGFNLTSEAVRDLRNSYVTLSMTYPSAYLYGLNESNIPQIAPEDYSNVDVDCNGSVIDNTLGINISGLHPTMNEPNVWDGSYDNPLLPLPADIKYTYYVSDVNFNIFCIHPDNTDGIVRADRQWLYVKSQATANGSTGNYLTGLSAPAPIMNNEITKHHFFADRITSYTSRHTKILATNSPFCNVGDWQTGDVNKVLSGIDEGDYPYFAGKVIPNKWYFGQPQKRADIVPADSYYLGGTIVSNGDENQVDSDWFQMELTSIQDIVLHFKNGSTSLDPWVDVIRAEDISSTYSNNASNILSRTQITTTDTSMIQVGTALLPGKYYLRVTYDLRTLTSTLQAEVWKDAYQFNIVTTPADCIVNLDLTNVELNTGAYQAINDIISNTSIEEMENVHFNAGLQILLNPGFEVKTNGIFQVTMDGCE